MVKVMIGSIWRKCNIFVDCLDAETQLSQFLHDEEYTWAQCWNANERTQ
jgi:hypothetical protein